MMIETSVENRIARIAMASPPVNALSPAFLAAFNESLDRLGQRNDWSVLHLSSRAKVFSAGGDLQSMAQWLASPSPGALMREYVEGVQRLFDRIEALPQATLAEIAGSALGGGLELALACDMRITSTTTKLGLPELGIGLLPGGGGTQRLTRLCGKATASRLILGAEIISGSVALDLGLVQWAEPEEQLSSKTASILARIAALPVEAISRAKSCMRAALISERSGYAEEVTAVSWLLEQPETRARITGFLGAQRSGAGGQARGK